MGKETIMAGDEVLEIDVKPVTIVCTAADFNRRLSYPGRFPIDPEATMHHIGLVKVFHEHTARMVAQVFEISEDKYGPGLCPVVSPDWCRQAGSGIMHVAGLIDLSLKLSQKGVPYVWVHPETFLHPRVQANLADIIIELAMNPPKTMAEVDEEDTRLLVDRLLGEEKAGT